MSFGRYDGKQVKDWASLVGHRCLVMEDLPYAPTFEVRIIEVSPKGRVNLEFTGEHRRWGKANEYLFIEDLGV